MSQSDDLFDPYRADEWEALVAIVRRAKPGASLALEGLHHSLISLLGAVGKGRTEGDQLFREWAEEDVPHAKHAAVFRKIARATDPLTPKLCTAFYRAALDRRAERKWSLQRRLGKLRRPYPLRDATIRDLTPQEVMDVREMAHSLAAHHASEANPAHRPRKVVIDTLLFELADIFLPFLSATKPGRYPLSHAEASRFIKFCSLSLRPFFPRGEASEITPKALSLRWKRLKKARRANLKRANARQRQRDRRSKDKAE